MDILIVQSRREPPLENSMTTGKSRHGCLTAWLILIIVASSLTAFFYLSFSAMVAESLPPGTPAWVLFLLPVSSVLNVVFAIALFRWQKWGFWGYLALSIVIAVMNLSLGVGVGTTIFGLFGVVLLYGVLHIGEENKGWPQLE